MSHSGPSRVIVLIPIAALLGFCAVMAPELISRNYFSYSALFPVAFSAAKALPPISIVLLFFIGVYLGMRQPKWAAVLGVSTMMVFPALGIIEKLADLTSHPGFAFEFAYYVLVSGAAVAGAYLGREILGIQERAGGSV